MHGSATFAVVADVCGVMSGALGLAGYAPEFVRTRRGIAKPPRLTWSIWTVQYGVLLGAQLVRGGLGFWLCLPALQLVGTATMAVVSVGAANTGRIDPRRGTAAACAAGAALVLWWMTANPVLAMVIVVAAEGVGMLAVARHAWRAPHEETMWIWRGCLVGGVFGVVAVLPTRSAVLAMYPVCFTVLAAIVVIAHRLGLARATTVAAASHPSRLPALTDQSARM